MSAAAPNVAQLRSQTDAALSQLIDAGTADGTTANLIEVLHSLCRRVELLEALAPQYSAPVPATTTVNPAGDVTVPLTELTPEPAAEEATEHGVSPETPA